jgi:hypothetical protein
MMLRHPETAVAKPLSVLGETCRVAKGLCRITPFYDRGEIKDGQWYHAAQVGPVSAKSMSKQTCAGDLKVRNGWKADIGAPLLLR